MSRSPRLSPRQRGLPVRSGGVVAPDDLQIYMPRALLEEVVDYAGRDLRRARGGVLLGYPGEHRSERYVEGRAHVAAENGLGDETNFRFTHEFFSELAAQHESLWPDTKIIGWYYTHLGSGIYLSSTDVQSHRNFFNLPHQFAMVLDPTAGTLGFFQWKNSEILPVGFHVFEPT